MSFVMFFNTLRFQRTLSPLCFLIWFHMFLRTFYVVFEVVYMVLNAGFMGFLGYKSEVKVGVKEWCR
jgi:hypothetical protein